MNSGRWIKVAGAGLLAGLVGAILMTLVMLLFRTWMGVATTTELIGDRVAASLDVWEFIDLLVKAGGYNELKQIGVASAIGGQLIAGALGGLLYAIIIERERIAQPEQPLRFGISRKGLLVVASLVTLIWIASLILLWPTLGTHYYGLPPGRAALVTVLGLPVCYAVCGAALMLAYRVMTSRAPLNRPSPLGQPIARRVVLIGGAGALIALASGWLLRRLYDLATFSYDDKWYHGAEVQAITPNDRFYVVTKNVVDPVAAKSVWRLEVAGLVERPHTYSFEELAALPATTQATTLMCISNPVGGGLMSNAVWKGIPLRTLIDAAGAKPGVVEVLLYGADGYTDTIAFEKGMDATTLVVYEMNGAPLPDRHGYPVRVIVPGLFGEKNVKWVTRIELVDHDAKGFYEKQGWGPSFVIPTHSRFDAPDFNQALRSGVAVMLKGIAFGGNRGVSRVEVSLDDGKTWQAARINYSSSPLEWVLWSYDWHPAEPGEHRLVVRAVDGTGELQTSEERWTAPSGATGYHRVTTRVEG